MYVDSFTILVTCDVLLWRGSSPSSIGYLRLRHLWALAADCMMLLSSMVSISFCGIISISFLVRQWTYWHLQESAILVKLQHLYGRGSFCSYMHQCFCCSQDFFRFARFLQLCSFLHLCDWVSSGHVFVDQRWNAISKKCGEKWMLCKEWSLSTLSRLVKM